MATYRLIGPGGQELESGEGEVRLEGKDLTVAPRMGQPLRIRSSDILAVSEPEPYAVGLRLAEGGVTVVLGQLGKMRTQILAELSSARSDTLASDLLLVGVGRPEVFPGAVDGADGEIRLYDDALVAFTASGDPIQVPYALVDTLDTDESGYQFKLRARGLEPIAINRLARRTTEFGELFRSRVTDARGRTGSFLAALLPGLGPLALRSAAGLLRDGLAAKATDLDAIEPTIVDTILATATIPDRRTAIEHLLEKSESDPRATLWIGFKQITSVATEAEGVTQWQDHSTTPNTDHDQTSGGLGSGFGGMMRASMLENGPPGRQLGFGAPFGGGMGNLLALSMLGVGMGGGLMGGAGGMGGGLLGGMGTGMGGMGGGANLGHSPTARPDMTRGRLKAAGVDLDALTATGEAPTVLAFAFLEVGDHVAYEVLNQGDHATYVYRGSSAVELNLALALLGFRVESIYTDGTGAGSRYHRAVERLPHLQLLKKAFVGRGIHTEGWAGQVDGLLDA